MSPSTEASLGKIEPHQDRASEQYPTVRNDKSVQEVSKHKARANASRHGKTDVRYWEQAIFQPKYTRQGQTRMVGEWSAKIQHAGRRETFSLGTPNKSAAADRAKKIYMSLHSAGWDGTLAEHKPKTNLASRSVVTVGDFIAEVTAKAGGRPKTIAGYCRCFRSIVADIFAIDGGTAKFDYRTGGRARWVQQVEAVKLADVTPELVQKWKVRFVGRAGGDPLLQRAARITLNSHMRQAKSLFAPAVLKFIQLEVPAARPFDGVEFEPRQSMRYRGGFNVEEVIRAAQKELPTEQLKIFYLGIMAGLRRNEIDKLEWPAFRWPEGVIRIEATRFFQPKSEDSVGDVEVDIELLELFKKFWADAKAQRCCASLKKDGAGASRQEETAAGDFVIASLNKPRPGATYNHYRAEKEFAALTKWLRVHGVTGDRPLHTLRKEYGSQVCAKHGIYAASHALRHSDIGITSQHYLDQKKKVTVGLGHLLVKEANLAKQKVSREAFPPPIPENRGAARR